MHVGNVTLTDTTQRNLLKKTAEEVKKERRNYKELIAELDWWNKYYVTKEDYVHVGVLPDYLISLNSLPFCSFVLVNINFLEELIVRG